MIQNYYRKSFFLTSLIVCILLGAFAVAQPMNDVGTAKQVGKAFVKVAKQASPAVVFVEAEKKVTIPQGFSQGTPFEFFGEDFFERFFGPRGPQGDQGNKGQQDDQGSTERHIKKGQGSGFIISSDGYIITNNHVVSDADKVIVKMADEREFEAEIVGTDPRSEIGVIKIEADNLPVLKFGDSDNIQVGEWVMAIGNPFGLSHTVTTGVVSAKGRTRVGITDYEDFIQTDAAINPGNSGGPLINMEGEAIGINTAIFSRSGGYMGIGFAIPSNMAKIIFNQIKETGSVTRGYLGIYIQELTPELAESFGIEKEEGILVADVTNNSPAKKAGLQEGDVIVGINDEPVKEVGPFRNKVSLMSPGTEIELEIFRKGEKITREVTIGKLPEDGQPAAPGEESPESDALNQLGFSVQNLTEELAQRFGYEGEQGVIVSEVQRYSEAANKGLRPGVLITEAEQQQVTNVKEFMNIVKNAQKDGKLLLRIKEQVRGGETASRYVVLEFD